MKSPSLGWQSWSPPFPKWHGFPQWDYPPFPHRKIKLHHKISNQLTRIRYWCSWYAHGWSINDQKISHTLSLISYHKLRFTHILIDDGWTTWGDWYTPDPSRFVDLTETVAQIRLHNLSAGLWFAPFLANKKSKLFQQHPEYFVTHKGRYIQGLKTFPIWNSILPQQYLLNLSLPAVKKYLTNFIDMAINNWGFTLLKLDFLYAPYFNPTHQSDSIAHKQVSWILNYIKRKHPHVTTIACGTPFAPALGRASSFRVSKDTALPPIVPNLLNSLIYRSRTAMLSTKLKLLAYFPHLNIDPDVRMFTLDSRATSAIWDTITTNILGVGDNLASLSNQQIESLKLWLTNHSSQ